MAKLNVCDICKSEGRLTEAKKYYAIRGHRNLRLDYCDNCKSKIPAKTIDYIILVYKLNGIDVTEEFARKLLQRT